jgi:D-arabinose 1-dehydrogenase-like Zn-dependent alcohol dehydrogenase
MLCGGVTVYAPLKKYGAGTTAKEVGIIGIGGLVCMHSILTRVVDLMLETSGALCRALCYGVRRERHRHLSL